MQPSLLQVPLTDLHFDPENPRLPERLKHAPDNDVIEYLLYECNLIELMLSIGEQDFFIGEPLLVVKADKGYKVVEGNRRLGALKLLQPQTEVPVLFTQVNQARSVAKHRPDNIPVLVFSQRDEILTYLGYRHITGIKEWDALAKARYLKQLRQKHGPDHAEAHKALAREIGSKSPHVAKLLTGLTLLEQAKDLGLLKKLRLQEEDIPFSLLTTGIGYENIAKFIGLENSQDVEAKTINPEQFEDFLTWVFAKSPGKKTVLGESRNFDKLARIVDSEQAISQLKSGSSIDEADLFTSGPLEAVRNLMGEIESRISSAQASLSRADGFDSRDVMQADRIRKACVALHSSIQGLVNPED